MLPVPPADRRPQGDAPAANPNLLAFFNNFPNFPVSGSGYAAVADFGSRIVSDVYGSVIRLCGQIRKQLIQGGGA
jgi:hypothetical protein